MATYKEIQKYTKEKYNLSVKSCWIADIKNEYGLTTRQAPNRINESIRTNPCPSNKRGMVIDALEHYGMIK